MSNATTNTLYEPRFEHDSCGIGGVVNIKGERSYATVDDALAEGKTACPVCIPAAGASVFVSEAPEEFASFAAGSN